MTRMIRVAKNCMRLLFLLTGVFCVSGFAESSSVNEPLPVETVLNTRGFSEFRSISFSPDGKWLAYAVRENAKNIEVGPDLYYATGLMHYAPGSRMFVKNLKTGDVRILPTQGNSWLPAWSPDSRLLAFLSDQGEDRQAHLWLWDASRDQLQLASNRPVRCDRLQWLPVGHRILFTVVPEGSTVSQYVARVIGNDRIQDHSSSRDIVKGLQVDVFRASERGKVAETLNAVPWNLDRYLRDLVLLDSDSGITKTVSHGMRIEAFYSSPDGTRVAYSVPTGFATVGAQQIVFELWIANLNVVDNQQLAVGVRLSLDGADFSWSPDGSKIALQDGTSTENLFQCKIFDTQTGNVTTFSSLSGPELRHEARRPLWKGNDEIYFVLQGALWKANIADNRATKVAVIPEAQIRWMIWLGENRLWTTDHGSKTVVLAHPAGDSGDAFYQVDLDNGTAVQVGVKNRCLTCTLRQPPMFLTPDERGVAYWPEDVGQYPDLRFTDFSSPERRITTLNPELEKYPVGEMRTLEWIGLDGQVLHGALLIPPSFQPGHPVPLIVWMYGGQTASNYHHRYGLVGGGVYNMQLFSSRGYAIFLPDAPQERNSPMLDLAKTVLPGVNKVIELGIADPVKLGIMGQSYGSYSTLSVIVQTPRFAAAVAIDGTSNLFSEYTEMDNTGAAYGIAQAEYGQQLLGGTPWQVPHRYFENSPFFRFDRIQTPVLIAQGAEDTAVAPFLADEIFVGLRRLGKEVEYAKYQHEGHDPGYWGYAAQTDLSNRILRWFDVHLKGEIEKTSAGGE